MAVQLKKMLVTGYCECFLSVLKYVADMEVIAIPDETNVFASVGIESIPTDFAIEASITVITLDLDKKTTTACVVPLHKYASI